MLPIVPPLARLLSDYSLVLNQIQPRPDAVCRHRLSNGYLRNSHIVFSSQPPATRDGLVTTVSSADEYGACQIQARGAFVHA
jgi:hypothetical protein